MKPEINNNTGAGKGDSPRNISKRFWEHYDEIDWGSGPKKQNDKSSKRVKKSSK
jgi:hypothetical protein